MRVSDLYAAAWKAPVDHADFRLPTGERLCVPAASGTAYASGSLTPDVSAAQADLDWADALLLHFPLWWFGMPAIMKGWIDRVWSFGFAYGVGEHSDTRWGDRYGEGRMVGKRAMLVVTAGGWPEHYGERGINGPIDDILFPINHGILFYPGFDVLPPFVLYRSDKLDDAGYERAAGDLRIRMDELFTASPIAYRRQNFGDYDIPSMELTASVDAGGSTGFRIHIAR